VLAAQLLKALGLWYSVQAPCCGFQVALLHVVGPLLRGTMESPLIVYPRPHRLGWPYWRPGQVSGCGRGSVLQWEWGRSRYDGCGGRSDWPSVPACQCEGTGASAAAS
jgi:hypothetical protein